MKVTCIQGSPKGDGNTATVLKWVEDELRAKGHEVDHIELREYQLNGCRECFDCAAVADAPGCSQEDDGNGLFLRLISSDAIILASPLFCWDFSARMRMLLERAFCLVSNQGGKEWQSLVDGRRFGLLVTGAGPVEKNMDLIQEVFQREIRWIKGENAGQLLVPNCTLPDEMGEDIRKQAVEFANTIALEP